MPVNSKFPIERPTPRNLRQRPSASRPSRWNRRHFRPESAFTVLELLVVVAVVAMLLALAFPAISVVRGSADQASCLNNLRNIDSGLQSYLAENRFIYHSHYWQWPLPAASIPPGQGNSWFTAAPDGRLTGSYIISSNFQLRDRRNPLNCPSNKKKTGSYYLGYAYNLSLAGISKLSLRNLQQMVTVIEGGDEARVTSGASNPARPQFLPGGTAYFAKGVLVPVHRNKCSALFADGHAEAVIPGELQARNFNPFLEID